MLPIYLKDSEFMPPADPVYYLLTQDGLFLVKRTPFFEAVVPAPGIPWLAPQQSAVHLLAARLPAKLLLQAVAFFQAVYRRYHSEAVALLGWRREGETFELVIPHQKAAGGHVDYQVRDFPTGLIRLGTIHSHAGIEAFHSERDGSDERYEDGFHLTVGNLDGDLTLSCSVVVQGFRGKVAPADLFTPFPIPWKEMPSPAAWDQEVEAKVSPLPRPIEFGT